MSRSWVLNTVVHLIMDRLRSTAGRSGLPPRQVAAGVLIRSAGREDVPAMHALYRSSLQGVPQERTFAHLVRFFPQLCCVAVQDSRPVGYAVGRVHRGFLTKGAAAFLFSIAVDASVRGEGIGRALVQRFVDSARSLGLVELDLEVERDNVAARTLYESFSLGTLESPPTGKGSTSYMAAKL